MKGKVKGKGESKGSKQIALVLATWGVALLGSIGEGLDTHPGRRYCTAQPQYRGTRTVLFSLWRLTERRCYTQTGQHLRSTKSTVQRTTNKSVGPQSCESPTKKQGTLENPERRGKRWDGPDIVADHTYSREHRPAESLPFTGPRTSIKDVYAKACTRRLCAVIGAMGV